MPDAGAAPELSRLAATQVAPGQRGPVVLEYPSTQGARPARPRFPLAVLLAGLLGLALIGGLIGVGLHNRPAAPAPTPVVMAEPDPHSGINPAIGLPIDGNGALTAAVDAPVIIDIYSDFSCPFCANFEATYADQLMELAADPNVSLRWHPVSVLDRSGDGTGFSTYAGAIFLEVAATQPDHVWVLNDFLLHNQSDLSGMSAQQLVDIINTGGFTLPPLETILTTRGPLLDQFTSIFRQIGATGVPHVLINGVQWTPGAQPWPNESLIDAARAAG